MPSTPVHRAVVVTFTSALVLAGCSANDAPRQSSDPCAIVTNGTPITKSLSAAQAPREISVAPEVATGYRSDMKAVHAKHFAVATANPLATQAACHVLNNGGSAADAKIGRAHV